MKVLFSKFAQQELNDAVIYYELEYEGLGRKFKEEVKKAAIRISEYPSAWSVERGDVRKCLLHKFPYKLLYSIRGRPCHRAGRGTSTPKAGLLVRTNLKGP